MKVNFKFYDYLCKEVKHVREEVFVKEQGFQDEFDKCDDKSVHLLLFVDREPIGTARLFQLETNKTFIIGRVAVLEKYRGLHLGNKIIKILEEKVGELGGTCVELSAQCRVQQFYEKLGYIPIGEPYLDEFCPHIRMRKEL